MSNDTEYPEEQSRELHSATASRTSPSFGMQINISIFRVEKEPLRAETAFIVSRIVEFLGGRVVVHLQRIRGFAGPGVCIPAAKTKMFYF